MDESDKEILFKAVLSDPASDTPRLALAEWLDRYGDPARAEFIRVQCGLAKCGPPHKRPAHADVPTPVKPLGDRHYAIHGFPGDEYRIGDRVDILVHRDLKAPRVVHGFRVYKIVPFTEPSMRGESTVYCRLDDESGPWKGTELLGRSDELMTPGNISAWSGQKAEAKRPVDRYGIRRIAVFGTPPSTDLEWTWSCGFVSAIRCSWAMWLRYADEIFWSPKQSVACSLCEGGGEYSPTGREMNVGRCRECNGNGGFLRPFPSTQTVRCGTCKGLGRVAASNDDLVHGRYPAQCVSCSGRGAGAQFLAETSQPIIHVTLTDYSGQVRTGESLSHTVVFESVNRSDRVMLRRDRDKGYWFDREKCATCRGSGFVDGDMDIGDIMIPTAQCPTCRGKPSNIWRCPAWPDLDFTLLE